MEYFFVSPSVHLLNNRERDDMKTKKPKKKQTKRKKNNLVIGVYKHLFNISSKLFSSFFFHALWNFKFLIQSDEMLFWLYVTLVKTSLDKDILNLAKC